MDFRHLQWTGIPMKAQRYERCNDALLIKFASQQDCDRNGSRPFRIKSLAGPSTVITVRLRKLLLSHKRTVLAIGRGICRRAQFRGPQPGEKSKVFDGHLAALAPKDRAQAGREPATDRAASPNSATRSQGISKGRAAGGPLSDPAMRTESDDGWGPTLGRLFIDLIVRRSEIFRGRGRGGAGSSYRDAIEPIIIG